jgi:hypothetical protein
MRERKPTALPTQEVATMIRTLRALIAVAVISAPFVTGSAANAQVCTALDPTCIAEETLGTVGDAIDDTVGAADDARGGAQEAADDAVKNVKGRADDVVTTVRETVDGIVDPGGNPPPGGGGGGGGSDPGNGGGTDGPAIDPGHTGTPQHHGAVPGRAGGSPRTTSTTGGIAATDPGPFRPSASDGSGQSDAGASPTIARVAADVIKGLALMALLLGAVTVFLTLQERLDKRDPKLLLASLGSDRVQFT